MWVPVFNDNESWARYYTELKEWKGTPYKHLKMVKGRGADCALFVAATWKWFGVISDVVYQYYPRDWYIHNPTEFVLNNLYWHMRHKGCQGYDVIKIDVRNPGSFIRGDVIGFATGSKSVTNHAAIWIGYKSETNERNKMINSINKHGVCELQYGTFWRNRTTTVFRVMRKL